MLSEIGTKPRGSKCVPVNSFWGAGSNLSTSNPLEEACNTLASFSRTSSNGLREVFWEPETHLDFFHRFLHRWCWC